MFDNFISVSVARRESIESSGGRGHGGVCLLYKESLKNGIEILETDHNGCIWVKLSKTYFGWEDDVCI